MKEIKLLRMAHVLLQALLTLNSIFKRWMAITVV